jgi:hypothetical protein
LNIVGDAAATAPVDLNAGELGTRVGDLVLAARVRAGLVLELRRVRPERLLDPQVLVDRSHDDPHHRAAVRPRDLTGDDVAAVVAVRCHRGDGRLLVRGCRRRHLGDGRFEPGDDDSEPHDVPGRQQARRLDLLIIDERAPGGLQVLHGDFARGRHRQQRVPAADVLLLDDQVGALGVTDDHLRLGQCQLQPSQLRRVDDDEARRDGVGHLIAPVTWRRAAARCRR